MRFNDFNPHSIGRRAFSSLWLYLSPLTTRLSHDTATHKHRLTFFLALSILLHTLLITYGLFGNRVMNASLFKAPAVSTLTGTLTPPKKTPPALENTRSEHSPLPEPQTNPTPPEPQTNPAPPEPQANPAPPVSMPMPPPLMPRDSAPTTLGSPSQTRPPPNSAAHSPPKAAETHYYAESTLSQKTEIMGDLDLGELPISPGRNESFTGRVLIDIGVSAVGLIDWVKVRESAFPPLYDEIIIQAVKKQLTFHAGKIGKKAVPTLVILEIMIDPTAPSDTPDASPL